MDYKERMKTEYRELKERYTKLHNLLVKYDAGTLGFEPNCPRSILYKQKNVMGEYLTVLEIRAEIEKVDLSC